jgi:preprotein translocase subunit SecB
MAEQEQDAARNQENHPVIHAQKIYIKDISFETPNSPQIFAREWKPNLNLDLGQAAAELPDSHYEVVLSLTVTVKVDDVTAYLAEVQQAGIFILQGFEPEQLHKIIHVHCPRMLYPYASFVISDLVTRSGFPQLLLAPVNFDALYKKRLSEVAGAQQAAGN